MVGVSHVPLYALCIAIQANTSVTELPPPLKEATLL